MKSLYILFTSAILLLISACGTTVYTVNPSKNDLSDHKTFAYLPNTNMEVEGKNYNDTSVNRSIVESVKTNLEEHGLTLDRKNPDLLVLISTSTHLDIEVVTSPRYAQYPYDDAAGRINPLYEPYYYYEYQTMTPIVGYNSTTFTHEEGTLVIDIIDRKTKNTVWKGIANDRIYDDPSTEVIKGMISDLFDEFPLEEENA